MFLLFYYIVSVISTFILLCYIMYKEEKYWGEAVSIYDIDISLIGILVVLSVIFGFLLFPYMIIRFIIEKN